MQTVVGRLAGIVVLTLLLVGAYQLIATASTESGPHAAKIAVKHPPQFSGTMMDGSNI